MPSPKQKAEPRTLYVCRYVKNAAKIIAWAKSQGFETTLPAAEMHVTICYSKTPVDWMEVPEAYPDYPTTPGESYPDELHVKPSAVRVVEALGDKGAVVLMFNSYELETRHKQILEAGATSDYPDYQPHVTITWKAPAGLDLKQVEPYRGPIVLGPEVFEEIVEEYKPGSTAEKGSLLSKIAATIRGTIVKTDDDQRMAYGWASVISEKGVPVVDTQGDIIEASEMLLATKAFMADARMAKAMHDGDGVGEVLHSFPLTAELAKSLGIEADREGWMVGVHVKDEDVWKKVKDGTYAAFSIGGWGDRVPLEE